MIMMMKYQLAPIYLINLLLLLSIWSVNNSSEYDLRESHLTRFDQLISSSSLGEPVFRLEPPSVINFANSKGAIIPCLASGSPRPKISWYSNPIGSDTSQQRDLIINGDLQLDQQSTSSMVTNVTGLRQIVQNGAAIQLLPFKEQDFRHDIHSTEYRCVASNYRGSIHSRSVTVQAGE